jgi:CDP-glucose 4,6-dehydratase
VLLTGHTGFKGSWLALWLQRLGARVHALSLPPATDPSHWSLLGLDVAETTGDIRDPEVVRRVVAQAQPEIVFHMAAQSLVRTSYRDPLATWSSNVMGTAHVLDACREAPGLRAIVVVTSDKCYENTETAVPFREDDRLGGRDPYSASKAATELVAASYRESFYSNGQRALVATARAGNVIGGGDWSADRLVPDLVRAVGAGRPLEVRNPQAVRPWQHVLEPLSGYLALGERLLAHEESAASAWNFGPADSDSRTVQAVLEGMHRAWPQVRWESSGGDHPHEAGVLRLDSSKAQSGLDWRPVWALDDALARTAKWYEAFLAGGAILTGRDLDGYVADAERAGLRWARA